MAHMMIRVRRFQFGRFCMGGLRENSFDMHVSDGPMEETGGVLFKF